MVDVVVLADLASEQWGMVTTAQAAAVGVNAKEMKRLADRGVLERVIHGIYRIAGTPAHVHENLHLAWLTLDPKRTASERLRGSTVDVVSHRSAAVMLALGDLDADVHEFTSNVRRQARRPDLQVKLHRGEVTRDDWTRVDGLPVTVPVRTVVDLARSHVDRGHLAGVVRDVLTTLHVDVSTLAATLRPFAHIYGARLGDGEGLLRILLEESGIPSSTRAVAELVPRHIEHADRT